MFVPKMKFVGSIEFEHGHVYGENLNDVTMMSSHILFFMKFTYISAKCISKRHIKYQMDQTYDN